MRDPSRIPKILEVVKRIWTKNPDLRLSQLLVNAIQPSSPTPEIFYREDDRLLEDLLNLEQRWEASE